MCVMCCIFWFGPHCAPYHIRCLLMHTGALYLTSEEHQPITACRLLHMYGIAAFLATFSLTLLSITVSHVTRHKWTLCDVTGYENMLVHLYSDLLLLARLSPLLHQVLVVKARRIYWRVVTSSGYLGSQQRASFRVMDRRMLLYPLIFFLCWGPGLFLHPNLAQEVSDVMKGLFGSETVSMLFPQRWVWLFFGW